MYANRLYSFFLLGLTVVLFSGCPGDRSEMTTDVVSFPFKGNVLLNGEVPQYQVQVGFIPTSEAKKKNSIPTYFPISKDGTVEGKLTEGEYIITFKLPTHRAAIALNRGDKPRKDVLKNKYTDPGESKFKTTISAVEGDAVNDIGEFKLEAELDPELKPQEFETIVPK